MKYLVGIAGVIALLLAGLWFGARHQASSLAVPTVDEAAGATAHGAAAFVGADFGGLSMQALESHALPWKLVTASLVLDAVQRDPSLTADVATLDRLLADFGFLSDSRVANLPDGVTLQPGGLPLGMTYAVLSPLAGAPVQVANLGCAACHSGVTYDAGGQPVPGEAWIGMPNSSLNLEAYTAAVFRAFKAHAGSPGALMDMVATLYPDTGWRETQTLRWLVLPLVRARLEETPGDRPLPFPNGVPGSTNGVAALKHVFGVPLIDGGPGDAGIVSIPDLGHRHWRNSLLADGAYAIPGLERHAATTAGDNTAEKRAALAAMTTFFTVPSMGVHPDAAIDNIATAKDIYEFLDKAYAPQPFPGQVDSNLAATGHATYAAECSGCHGTYRTDISPPELVSFPNWSGDTGTDPLRAAAFSQELISAFEDTPYRDQIAVKATRAYAAPPLDGLWASAPYLHNGSVPTIWALLSPQDRPDVFELGGHALDFEHLGLRLVDGRYPAGYVPFSRPALFDTTLPGHGNAGHVYGETLSDGEKRALIEFLKQL
ncbi:MAG: hypothetical protein AAGB10_15855 [Pseudomonadota bacterium]